jgi:hypothetical protein
MLPSSNKDINIVGMGWTTIVDLQMKLVIHVAINVTKTEIDAEIVDPDGLPLVWVEGKHVTRVRRMTDEEFMKYAKEYGFEMEVEMRVWHNTEKDVPKTE